MTQSNVITQSNDIAQSNNITQSNIITQSNVITQLMLHSVTIHLKKQSPFKENIHVTKGMTFSDLINFVFPAGAPKDKRFIFKSSFEAGGKQFLPEQIMHNIFMRNVPMYGLIWKK